MSITEKSEAVGIRTQPSASCKARRGPFLIATLITGGLIAVACGGDSPQIQLEPAATAIDTNTTLASPEGSTSESTATTTTQPDIKTGQWVNATGNLVGMESWCGNLAFVSARPDTDEVYASVVGQGWFSSTVESPEWTPFARRADSAPLDHRTSSVLYDPVEPGRFWESGFFGLGPPPVQSAADANRTDDGGETFVALGTSAPADMISVDFTDPDRRTLVIGTHGRSQALRSTDGGVTWRDISAGLPSQVGDASFPHVIDATTYLLGTFKGQASGIFRTVDGGTTWNRVFEGAVSGPPLASMDGNLYWVLEQGGVIKSPDEGATWEPTSRAVAGGERAGRIVELEDGTWISRGAEQMIVSRDRGQTWRGAGPALPYTPNGFTYSTSRAAVYIWRNYCNVDDDPDPVLLDAILRLDLDPSP